MSTSPVSSTSPQAATPREGNATSAAAVAAVAAAAAPATAATRDCLVCESPLRKIVHFHKIVHCPTGHPGHDICQTCYSRILAANHGPAVASCPMCRTPYPPEDAEMQREYDRQLRLPLTQINQQTRQTSQAIRRFEEATPFLLPSSHFIQTADYILNNKSWIYYRLDRAVERYLNRSNTDEIFHNNRWLGGSVSEFISTLQTYIQGDTGILVDKKTIYRCLILRLNKTLENIENPTSTCKIFLQHLFLILNFLMSEYANLLNDEDIHDNSARQINLRFIPRMTAALNQFSYTRETDPRPLIARGY